jgi:hypothetical protein
MTSKQPLIQEECVFNDFERLGFGVPFEDRSNQDISNTSGNDRGTCIYIALNPHDVGIVWFARFLYGTR